MIDGGKHMLVISWNQLIESIKKRITYKSISEDGDTPNASLPPMQPISASQMSLYIDKLMSGQTHLKIVDSEDDKTPVDIRYRYPALIAASTPAPCYLCSAKTLYEYHRAKGDFFRCCQRCGEDLALNAGGGGNT